MAFGPFLADVLAELVPAQERDELRTDDDRHDHRDHRRGEDADHASSDLRERGGHGFETDRP